MKCGDEVIKADSYVVALGSWSTALMKNIVDIPVYPLKGYSLTIPVTNADAAPVSTILDETYKVAVTRFDNRIRVGGMAEIVGFNTKLPEARRETLEMVVTDLYPEGGCQPGQFLDRPASYDARRYASCRGDAAVQSLSEYRTRHTGLDNGLWLRSVTG